MIVTIRDSQGNVHKFSYVDCAISIQMEERIAKEIGTMNVDVSPKMIYSICNVQREDHVEFLKSLTEK